MYGKFLLSLWFITCSSVLVSIMLADDENDISPLLLDTLWDPHHPNLISVYCVFTG